MFSLIDRISMKQSECGRASPQYQLWYQSEDEGGLRASLDWFLLKSKQRKINWKFLPSISEIWVEIDARSISITTALHLPGSQHSYPELGQISLDSFQGEQLGEI